jgi:hypothetical protein
MELRLKMLPKDELIIKSGEFVRHWIFVSAGKLRIERDAVIEHSNYWPGSKADSQFVHRDEIDHKMHSSSATWIQNKQCRRKVLKLTEITAMQSFGLQEIYACKEFS